MLKQPVYIQSIASISALGMTSAEIWSNYLHENSLFQKIEATKKEYWISKLSDTATSILNTIISSDTKYKHLDKSVVMAILVARKCFENSYFSNHNVGINFGSSRGATTLFEKYHTDFINEGSVSTFTSPATTLGNISSWVSHDLQTDGPEISHSITCSTGLHALLNGIAWLQSGMCNHFLAGASEAPLTPFTLSQMTALKVYSNEDTALANRCLDFGKTSKVSRCLFAHQCTQTGLANCVSAGSMDA